MGPERIEIATVTLEEPEPNPDAVQDVVYPVVGRAVRRIRNSRFCDVHILGQWNEALDKAQILLPENRPLLTKLQEEFMESSEEEAFLVLKGQQLSQSLLPKVLCLTNSNVLKMLKPYLSAGLGPKIFSVDSDPVEMFLALKEVTPGGDVSPVSPEDRTGVLQDSRLPKLVQMTGVDVIVADLRTEAGEFGQEENLTKDNFLLLCLLALKSLPAGGVLVCCVHTVLTRFTAGLVYILHSVFNKVSLSPLQTDSRPSQLLVCAGYRGYEPTLLEVLQEVRQTLCELQGDRDVLEVVPMQQLLGDGRFQHFLKAANEAVLYRSLATVVRWEKQLLQNSSMQGTEG
ncbi:cap-specific mRNA (nucleoside-2'-O-)-methyltransferase 2-like [Branchiostoma floridae]|uniref:Cap-specific mRNA (Nucleoside-2'-O-)-methyltransferase 2-like n=1 Tax=Branchiostoma floridae TaxID=7739 RepID=A0A9J7N0C0_BRAFL|nr:cap-specific mRNA (nucleoside-2'-O-)-methyltransferase 2-like [Branchiostoma floridae]